MKNGIQKNYLIALAVVIGVIVVGFASSYAYFAITMTSAQDAGPDFVASVDASSESVTITQLHGINNPDKRPGYKDYLSFSITSTSSVNYDVTMNAVSTLVTGVNYKVYKSTSSLTVASTCSDSDDAVNNQYSSSCTVTGLDLLTPEATGQISSATAAYTLLEGETLNGTVYYYIVLEYPNENFSQDDDFFKTLTATVSLNIAGEINTTQPRQLTTAMLQDNGITDINDVPERTNSGGIQYLSSSKYYNASQLDIKNRGFNATKTADTYGASGAFDEIYVGEDINIFRTNNAENGETVLYYSGANGYAKDYTYKGQSIYNFDDTLATLDGTSVDLIRVGGRYYLKDDTKVVSITPTWTKLDGTCVYAGHVIADENNDEIASKADCEKQVNILDNQIYTGEFIENVTPTWSSYDCYGSEGSEVCSERCEYNGYEVYDEYGHTIYDSSTCEILSTLVPSYDGNYKKIADFKENVTPTWATATGTAYACKYNNKMVFKEDKRVISSENDCTSGNYYVNNDSYTKIKSEDYITNAILEADYVGVNNWVIFGKCPATGGYNCTAGDDLYWRIIRTNEASTGGGIRLLYSGSGLAYDSNDSAKHIIKSTVNNGVIGKTTFNSTSNGYKYVGYTYGNGTNTLSSIRGNDNDSTIKAYIDNWYKATLLNTDYEKEINTKAVYCNDRSTTTSNSTLTEYVYFGAYDRLYTNKTPSYACGASPQGFGNWYTGGNDNADRYTATLYELGNGYLDYPVALMTADEVVFGGGKYDTSNSKLWYWANPNGSSITNYEYWWLMSAYYGYSYYTNLFAVSGGSYNPGSLINYDANYSYDFARPSLSLKSDTLITGQGTATDPYVVQVRQ